LLLLLPIFWLYTSHFSAVSAVLLGWLAIVVVITAIAERLVPNRSSWHPNRQDVLRDSSLFAINALADKLADVAVASIAIYMVSANRGLMADWPMALQIVLGILVAELGSYVLHRASHRSTWLWKVHVAHHLPAAVNASNSFNAHPLNALLNKFVRMAPLLPLGLSADAILFVALFGLLQNVIVHANVRGQMGVLNLLIGTGELHRLHHSTRLDQAGNYGTSVPLWDQLFGTFHWGTEPEAVGVTEPDRYPSPYAIKQLLALPFCPLRSSSGLPQGVERARQSFFGQFFQCMRQ